MDAYEENMARCWNQSEGIEDEVDEVALGFKIFLSSTDDIVIEVNFEH